MEARDRRIVEVGKENVNSKLFRKHKTSSKISSRTRRRSRVGLKKANFRTFITSLAALWMNFNDVIARTADGQASPLLMCAQTLRQITSMSLTVQMAMWVQAVLEHVATV